MASGNGSPTGKPNGGSNGLKDVSFDIFVPASPFGLKGKGNPEPPVDKAIRVEILRVQMGTLGILIQAAEKLVPVLLTGGAQANDKITDITLAMLDKLNNLVTNPDESEPEIETKELRQ